MQTYEISQYEKRQLNSSNRNAATKHTAASSNYNYDTYFNMNLQKNVTFDNFDMEQELREAEKEAKKLRIENARLYDHIKAIDDKLKEKDYEVAMLQDDIKTLSERNEDLAALVKDREDKMATIQEEQSEMSKQCNTLLAELNKSKGDLGRSLEENDFLKREMRQLDQKHSKLMNEALRENDLLSAELNKRTAQHKDDIASLKNKLDKMHLANSRLVEENKRLLPLEGDNKLLIDEINQLKNESKTLVNNSTALIDDLKNQIDLIRNHASVLEKEKKNLEKANTNNKKINDELAKEANEKIAQLQKDNETYHTKAFDYKKLNQALVREKEGLIAQLNQLQNEIHRLKPQGRSQSQGKLKTDNAMLIECLKGENEELKYQLQKTKRMADLLLQFVNNLSVLFDKDELSFEHCKDFPEELKESLTALEFDIERLLNSKAQDGHDAKWKSIEDKLLYRPQEGVKRELSQEQEGLNYKMGKCSACDLGCNATLKGCSPLFAKSNLNPTNLPLSQFLPKNKVAN